MNLSALREEALHEVRRAATLQDLETAETKLLGRKDGALTRVLRGLKDLSPEEKKTVGQGANDLRLELEAAIAERRRALRAAAVLSETEKTRVDLTLPGVPLPRGGVHPVQQTIRDITAIFREIGFVPVEGPEIETDRNNFTDLNIPADHPARDAHDTFYLRVKEPGPAGAAHEPLLLRTHTSPVQIRLMRAVPPPIRIIAPGRVFRHEATDATHAAVFHQIEGLAVDEGITFTDLKGTLRHFARRFFGPELAIRFRPSYFSFVEPGAEMDLQCFRCGGAGRVDGAPCGLCKASGWIEMLGAGMVNPQVLRNVNCDPERYTGFAFGMGIERIVATKLKVPDIRLFLEPDMRFLEQFL